MLENLKTLCLLDGTSAREEKVREYIIDEIHGKCQYHVDAMGNIIVFKKGKSESKNKVLLTAHMDEVGFIITKITDDGYLKFDTIGGVDSSVVCGKMLKVGEFDTIGIVGTNHIHLCQSDERKSVPSISKLYIDIGAKSKEEAEKLVEIGDAAYFVSDFVKFGENKVKAKAIDDRFGCSVMLNMINSELEHDLYFAFLVQEEVGLRGGSAACFAVRPDYAIVIESTTASDIAFVDEADQVCTLGGGAVVSFMDRATVYSTKLFKKAFELAKENGIKCQTKTTIAGGNDAGAIHKSIDGVRTLTVSLPCRYIHSGTCVADTTDMTSCQEIVNVLAKEFVNA